MHELDPESAARLSDLVGTIHDCALAPHRWAATCRAVGALSQSAAGGLFCHSLPHGRCAPLFAFGDSSALLLALGRYHDGSPPALSDAVAPLGEVKALSMERFHPDHASLFQEVLGPFAISDTAWFLARRTDSRILSMHVARLNGAPPYGLSDLRLLQLLAPHVCRALSISDALEQGAVQSQMLEQTLDALSVGVFLTERSGRVRHMNRAAAILVHAGTTVRLVGDRLWPLDDAARAELQSAIAEAAADPAHHTAAPDVHVVMPDGGGGGCIARVRAIPCAQRDDTLMPIAGAAAVFMQEPASAARIPVASFGKLHGLSEAELRVLLAMSRGMNGREAAGALGLSEATVRTHLRRLYAKTGTSKHGELLQLLRNATPPLHEARHAGSSDGAASRERPASDLTRAVAPAVSRSSTRGRPGP